MNSIDSLFQKLRAEKRKAFMPFITAGDPNLAVTARLLREFASRGAALVEIGFPYSDPIADGSVVQASYTRALQNGLRVDDIFSSLRSQATGATREETGDSLVSPLTCPPPLVAMVSYSLVHHRGPARFIAQAQEAGFAGAIVPDLPVEEAQELADVAGRAD